MRRRKTARPWLRALSLVSILAISQTTLAGCMNIVQTSANLPVQSALVRGRVVAHCDFAPGNTQPVLEDLARLNIDMKNRLGLPASNEPVHIYLFETSEKYDEFMSERFPELPSRRAMFVATESRSSVYVAWSDRIAEDLRHEVSHAYLHAAVPALPLWLDEGLAEYYETPVTAQGFHREHAELLKEEHRQSGWRPNLRRLESMGDVASMSQLDYAECWLWARFLLDSQPERAELLKNYLLALRKRRTALPLSSYLLAQSPDPDGAVDEFLQTQEGPRGVKDRTEVPQVVPAAAKDEGAPAASTTVAPSNESPLSTKETPQGQ